MLELANLNRDIEVPIVKCLVLLGSSPYRALESSYLNPHVEPPEEANPAVGFPLPMYKETSARAVFPFPTQ